jgi:hypothetical protein
VCCASGYRSGACTRMSSSMRHCVRTVTDR